MSAMSTMSVDTSVLGYSWNPYKNDYTIQSFRMVPKTAFSEEVQFETSSKRLSNASAGSGQTSPASSCNGGLSLPNTRPSTPPSVGSGPLPPCQFPHEMEFEVLPRRHRSFQTPKKSGGHQLNFSNPAASCGDTYIHSVMGADLIAILRAQPSDAAITQQLACLSHEAIISVFGTLVSTPELVLSLCRNDRGNVIVHLFASVNAAAYSASLDALFQSVVAVFPTMMTDKLGALALTRLYDNVPACSSYRHCFDALVLQHFETIVCHPYGNFLVSQLIKCVATASTTTSTRIQAIFCNPDLFPSICVDKFGSHTAEVWAQYAPAAEFKCTLEMLLKTPGLLQTLANSLTGNNPLQRLLFRLHRSSNGGCRVDGADPDTQLLSQMWKETRGKISSGVRGCTFERMVLGSLNGRARPQQGYTAQRR